MERPLPSQACEPWTACIHFQVSSGENPKLANLDPSLSVTTDRNREVRRGSRCLDPGPSPGLGAGVHLPYPKGASTEARAPDAALGQAGPHQEERPPVPGRESSCSESPRGNLTILSRVQETSITQGSVPGCGWRGARRGQGVTCSGRGMGRTGR